MKRLRISAISFLNTAPLMWDFEHRHDRNAPSQFDISYTLPSQCAADLAAGAADIGIIPAAAYASITGLAILPGVAIASRRPVRSILLVSKVPLDRIQSVALDTSSLTSVALTRVLFEKWWGAGRTFTPMAPDLEKMLKEHDAGLVIGDPALRVDRSRYFPTTWPRSGSASRANLLFSPSGPYGSGLWRMFRCGSIWPRYFSSRATTV